MLVYFEEYSIENVSNAHLVKLITGAGYKVKVIPANSVLLAIPLDNEVAREKLLSVIKRAIGDCIDDGPVSVSFGAQSIYDDDKSGIILQVDHWDLCTEAEPPRTIFMKDFDTFAGPKRQCSAFAKSGVQCTRKTYHESGECWQHRIDTGEA